MGESIKQLLGEDIVFYNQPASKYCTFRLGGPIEVLVLPKTQEQLLWCLHRLTASGLQFRVLGNMSNILPSDGLNRGIYIATSKMESSVKQYGTRLIASSGESLSKLACTAQKLGLSGLEGLVGIPATVGGAIANNAGAFGWQISDSVESLLVFEKGKVASIDAKLAGFTSHHSSLAQSGKIVIAATFNLKQTEPESILNTMKEIALKRSKLQPSYPSAGSVFSKVGDTSAGYYIDQAGLKGEIYDGAAISEVHANFIVNLGGATSASVKHLINLAQNKVNQKFGINLVPEIEIWGDTNEQLREPTNS